MLAARTVTLNVQLRLHYVALTEFLMFAVALLIHYFSSEITLLTAYSGFNSIIDVTSLYKSQPATVSVNVNNSTSRNSL